MSSHLFSYLLGFFSTFGKYEIGMVKKLPVPEPRHSGDDSIGSIAKSIFDAKRSWDKGNEVSTMFEKPWLAEASTESIQHQLAALASYEASQNSSIQVLFSSLNDHVFDLYGLHGRSREAIEGALGEQPAEHIWPQMEGEKLDQKRMEHVWRLLSFAVKRVVEADEDGVVPFYKRLR